MDNYLQNTILFSERFFLDYIFQHVMRHVNNYIHTYITACTSYCGLKYIRVFHMLAGIADACPTGDLAMSHWNDIAKLGKHDKYPSPLQIYRQIYNWVIYFEFEVTWKEITYKVIFESLLVRNVVNWKIVTRHSHLKWNGVSIKWSHWNCTCLDANIRCQDSRQQIHW